MSQVKLRLLVLASTYPRWEGDPEPGFVHELSKRLVKYFDITVLCPHSQGARTNDLMDGVKIIRYRYAPSRFEKLVNNGGIMTNLRRHPWMMFLLPGFILSQLVWLWRLTSIRKTDMVHAHWIVPQGFLMALLKVLGRRVPFMVTAHGADVFALRGKFFASLKNFTLQKASLVSVVSSAMKQKLADAVAEEKIVVEPMGVDLQKRFCVDSAIERHPGEILFVGRLVEKKGLRFLIQALPHVLQKGIQARLLVAGFGPELINLQQQVSVLGLQNQVTFLGAVSQAELPDLYRRASVFAAPFIEAGSGDQEGLGLVVLEALGCGCEVLISDLPATREFGEIKGLFRVPAANSEALADQLIQILSQPSRQNTQKPDEAIMRFDWETRADAYAGHLLKIAGDRLVS